MLSNKVILIAFVNEIGGTLSNHGLVLNRLDIKIGGFIL